MAHRAARAALVLALCATGCGSSLVQLGSAVPITPTPSGTVPLEITTREVRVADPLPLPGTHLRFAGLEEPLGHAVATAAVPWADLHRGERAGGWQLQVELIGADVERRDARIEVEMQVRATLRGRDGNVYLAQTQAHCREGAVVEAAQSAPVFYHCMMDLGRELAGWLGGVQR